MRAALRQCRTLIGAIAIAASLAACARSWSFVQSVGGIAVGTPTHAGETWVLPVEADVSGLRNVTTKGTQLNSGIVCKAVTATVEGNDIYLALRTWPAGTDLGGVAKCPAATLGAIRSGRYTVFYQAPGEPRHLIGSVWVGTTA